VPDVTEPWEQKFLQLLPLIDKIVDFQARRHRLSSADADDFRSEIKVKFIENDYAILRGFEGRSSMQTFLATVVTNALHDRLNSEWGKWRPSTAALRAGPDGVLLERLIGRDGFSLEEAIQIMTTNYSVARSRSELEEIASTLPVRFRRRFESEQAILSLPGSARADESVLERDWRAVWDRVLTELRSVQDQLDSQDALILVMRFQDGMQLADIATTLGIKARPLYDRVYKLLTQLRLALEAQGVSAVVVRQLFDEQDGVSHGK
jgi:RNA polymerase sigma factor (sigma-70 family)